MSSSTAIHATAPAHYLVVREHGGAAFWEVKWLHRRPDGITRQAKRRLGPAWVQRDASTDEWVKRPGRTPAGLLDRRSATVVADDVVRQTDAEMYAAEVDDRARREAPVTFREVAADYMVWLEHVQDAKPSTLYDYRCRLAEPGQPYARGNGETLGHIMRALGDLPAAEVTPRDVNAMLTTIAATGVSSRTVNRTRSLVAAIYGYASDPATFALATNPAATAQRRRENDPGPMDYYRPEDVEAIARALAAGAHRDRNRPAITDDERARRRQEDEQDADIVRVAAYAGLRRGELLALRWSDVDFTGGKITVSRAISGGEEAPSTKSRKAREVPLTAQAAAAIDRVSRREDFIGRDDYVFANRIGRRLDGSALRHRYVRARDSTGLRPLPFHSLRHAFGSRLVAAGVDLVTVKSAMGHSSITTTERYLHARPAVELADRFSQAFTIETPHDAVPAGTDADKEESGRGA